MKKEEPVEKKELHSPDQRLSLLSDRIASMNLRDAPTKVAAVQPNNNALNQFNFGSNVMFQVNPRIGSRFNDAFSPATHQQRSFSFGSFDASHRASNPLRFGSIPFFFPIVFDRGHTATFGDTSNPSCSNDLKHENDKKMNWPVVKSGMCFLF